MYAWVTGRPTIFDVPAAGSLRVATYRSPCTFDEPSVPGTIPKAPTNASREGDVAVGLNGTFAP